MRTPFDAELQDRLMRYAAIDSQSDESSTSQPSTPCQLDMSRLLVQELEEMGAEDVTITEYGAVLATIPATAEGPVVGLCAHVDTTPQFNATGVKPRLIKGYDGGDISFPDAPERRLGPDMSPHLKNCIGHDLITASGTTLLGGDDKAGVSVIMTAARHLLANPDIPRAKLRLAFTPDEEIGRGVDERLPADMACDFAYTFDGPAPGEVQHETFSADRAFVTIRGVSIHPGWAKDKLVNATHLAAKIVQGLPQTKMTPEMTKGNEGFIHITDMSGDAAEMTIGLIIRDFEREGLAKKGDILRTVCSAVALTEPRAEVICEITPQYRNMRYWLEKDMTPVDLVHAAIRDVGLEPVAIPIRGGTDGSRLTELGVPCPNVFCGMQEIHGPLEWISVQDMGKATEVALRIAQRAAKA
ncbi:peptidase T [Sulfitobacter donghicola]|uniref:Peptidase T n=1 Tax=Sulfitobacter donghicola DSW-25 = KCTC 12864 = JCM 14565 TaxID=1300350 RepID=A0A073IK94_9RHOB|nr:peptidase T [Sulfitobacter donghicola]KEJ89931.1 peptidase T [Sulfitobacter donghicola DSW-25 = KCTC 12864 = JCM 14565]KIN66944.1 Peptidase T [Sulfitobacter donghicola DSW-25 = KCTC 12864 = JCM 14565]